MNLSITPVMAGLGGLSNVSNSDPSQVFNSSLNSQSFALQSQGLSPSSIESSLRVSDSAPSSRSSRSLDHFYDKPSSFQHSVRGLFDYLQNHTNEWNRTLKEVDAPSTTTPDLSTHSGRMEALEQSNNRTISAAFHAASKTTIMAGMVGVENGILSARRELMAG